MITATDPAWNVNLQFVFRSQFLGFARNARVNGKARRESVARCLRLSLQIRHHNNYLDSMHMAKVHWNEWSQKGSSYRKISDSTTFLNTT